MPEVDTHCKRCGGDGTVEIKTPAGGTQTVVCPRCKGTGQEPKKLA